MIGKLKPWRPTCSGQQRSKVIVIQVKYMHLPLQMNQHKFTVNSLDGSINVLDVDKIIKIDAHGNYAISAIGNGCSNPIFE